MDLNRSLRTATGHSSQLLQTELERLKRVREAWPTKIKWKF